LHGLKFNKTSLLVYGQTKSLEMNYTSMQDDTNNGVFPFLTYFFYTLSLRISRKILWSSSKLPAMEGSPLSTIRRPPNDPKISLQGE